LEWFGEGDDRVQAVHTGHGAGRLDRILEAGSTRNGVFGLTLQWRQIPDLMSAFGRNEGLPDIDALLAGRFDARRYIWLRRRNKVAQAIANYRASVSSAWTSGANLDEPPTLVDASAFDADRIEHHLALVEHFDRQWEAWFRANGHRALVVIYEDFCEQYEQTLRVLCDFIGAGASGFRAPPPRGEDRPDAMSLDWEARFRRLKGLNAVAPPLQIRILSERPAWSAAGRLAVAAPVGAQVGPAKADKAAKIKAYDRVGRNDLELVPAPRERDWMGVALSLEATQWLPLKMANQHGWLVLCPHRIEATWDGSEGCEAVSIRQPETIEPLAFSVFGSGVLTIVGGLLLRTPDGVNLHVRGPANHPKDGMAPLESIVEADWSDTTFAMHWKFTRANQTVVFEAGEPFAMISPVRRGDVEAFDAERLPISDSPCPAGRQSAPGPAGAPAEVFAGARTLPHQTRLFVSAFRDLRPPLDQRDQTIPSGDRSIQ
jgi:LPS sulfotransferase NodH